MHQYLLVRKLRQAHKGRDIDSRDKMRLTLPKFEHIKHVLTTCSSSVLHRQYQ